jgi:hypothetical protein
MAPSSTDSSTAGHVRFYTSRQLGNKRNREKNEKQGNETSKRFSLRTPTMLWCSVGTQYKKQKLPRTGRGAYVLNRLCSMSQKREQHATRQHRHVAMVVVWVLWRTPNADAAQRTNKTGAVTSECARRRKRGYPNRSVEQQSTTEVRRQDWTGGPSEILFKSTGQLNGSIDKNRYSSV